MFRHLTASSRQFIHRTASSRHGETLNIFQQTCLEIEQLLADMFRHFFQRFFYWVFNIFLVQYNYSIENWVWLGLELQWFLLMHGAAWPPLFIGDWPPRLPFPKQGGHSAATESLLSLGSSHSTSTHPSVLASQVAWITGESHFSRLEPFLPARAISPG